MSFLDIFPKQRPPLYPSDIEYVGTDQFFSDPTEGIGKKTVSDGGSTGYFVLPDHATELRHLISYAGMSKARGDIFKACYRLGNKEGVSVEYDLKKMEFFIKDLIEMHSRGERL